VKSRVVVNFDDELENRGARSNTGAALRLSFFVDAGGRNASCVTPRGAQPSAGTASWDTENILRCEVFDTTTAVRRRSEDNAEFERGTAKSIINKIVDFN
jgi:hypothetical protein